MSDGVVFVYIKRGNIDKLRDSVIIRTRSADLRRQTKRERRVRVLLMIRNCH